MAEQTWFTVDQTPCTYESIIIKLLASKITNDSSRAINVLLYWYYEKMYQKYLMMSTRIQRMRVYFASVKRVKNIHVFLYTKCCWFFQMTSFKLCKLCNMALSNIRINFRSLGVLLFVKQGIQLQILRS